MTAASIPTFDALYRDSEDPWSTATRWYEERRRALLLACLPARHFATAYEAGCGNGNVSEELARRCGSLLASDASAEAVRLATTRLASLPHVTVAQQRLPVDWPERPFDLIVLSEVLYFLDTDEIATTARAARSAAGPAGIVVACDWRDDIEGFGHRGDAAHRHFEETLALPRLFEYADDDILLTGWSVDTRSVAVREGVR